METHFQPLIDLIITNIVAQTWTENGGSGSIKPFQFQDRCLLDVRQTEEVHEQIAAFLRRRSAVPATLEKPCIRGGCRGTQEVRPFTTRGKTCR